MHVYSPHVLAGAARAGPRARGARHPRRDRDRVPPHRPALGRRPGQRRRPDILCVGKALTGGYLTLAAVLCTRAVAEGVSAGEAGGLMHGPTFMGNPLACAIASANLDLLAARDTEAEVGRIERGLTAGLERAASLTSVAQVRVLGAVGVVQLREPVRVAEVTAAAIERGVWVRPFRDLVYTMPPYVTSDDDLAAAHGRAGRRRRGRPRLSPRSITPRHPPSAGHGTVVPVVSVARTSTARSSSSASHRARRARPLAVISALPQEHAPTSRRYRETPRCTGAQPLIAPVAGQAGEYGQPVGVHPLGPGQHGQHGVGLRTVRPRRRATWTTTRPQPARDRGDEVARRQPGRPDHEPRAVARRALRRIGQRGAGQDGERERGHGPHPPAGGPPQRLGPGTATHRALPGEEQDAHAHGGPHPLPDQDAAVDDAPEEHRHRPDLEHPLHDEPRGGGTVEHPQFLGGSQGLPGRHRSAVGQQVIGASHHGPSMAAPWNQTSRLLGLRLAPAVPVVDPHPAADPRAVAVAVGLAPVEHREPVDVGHRPAGSSSHRTTGPRTLTWVYHSSA